MNVKFFTFLYQDCCLRQLHNDPYKGYYTHWLNMVQVWFRTVNNKGQFAWRSIFSLPHIQTVVKGSFMKIHVTHCLHMVCIWFGIVKNKGHFTWCSRKLFSHIWTVKESLTKIHINITTHTVYSWCKFGLDLSRINSTVHKDQGHNSLLIHLLIKEASWRSIKR